jgi:hypothetical protein
MSLNDKRLPTKQDVNWLRACDHLVPYMQLADRRRCLDGP